MTGWYNFTKVVQKNSEIKNKRGKNMFKNKLLSAKFIVILIGIGLLIVCSFSKAEGADWKCFHFSEKTKTTYYFETESIDILSKERVRVWMATVETSGEYNKLFLEFKCEDRVFHILSAIQYDKEDRVKNSYQFETPNWISIPSESVIETLYETLCLLTK
ncbi:MAG: surface-adhesin E family protein [Thermodesulfobacteriota bacterium]